MHKSPGINQILAEMIKAGGNTLLSEIHKLLTSVWNKEERNLLLYLFTRVIKIKNRLQ
jgi:hypothetical protein